MKPQTGVMNIVPDEEAISRILEGEQRLYEVLIRKYNPRLYRIGMSVLQDEAETEDAMQTAYISAYEHLADFQHRSSFGTWLTRIMLNQCLGQKRRKKPEPFPMEESDNLIHMKTPMNELVNKELNNVLEQAINQLPEKYRLVFVMREIETMSVHETSEALNIEEPNVKVRLNRAKVMLRKNLNGYMKDQVFSFHLVKCDRMVKGVFDHLGIS